MMKRVLCIRFPNWPIQCLRHQLRETGATNAGISSTAVALHTAAPVPVEDRKQKTQLDEDTRFIRAFYSAAQSGPAIVAVSADAWAQGVRPGMPLIEARCMAQPPSVPAVSRRQGQNRSATSQPIAVVEFHEWQPQRDRAVLKATAELTRRYAPVVGLDVVPMPDSLLLDITGCGPLFGGESGLAESLLKDLRQAGWQCRIAIAQSVSAVWALTHADVPRRQEATQSSGDRRRPHRHIADSLRHELPIQIVPAGQARAEIDPLPVATSRLDLPDLEILRHLGIRTIGQLLTLPREDLPSRLSALAVLRIQQLLEVVDEPIDPLPEANPVAAAWCSDDPASGFADLQYLMEHLTQRISEQLERRRMACSSVVCQFKCADGSVIPLTASVVKPTQSAELLKEVLCLRIETEATLATLEASAHTVMNPGSNATAEITSSPSTGPLGSLSTQLVHSVTMTAQVAPLPVAKQRDLFSPEEHIVPQEELANLISRLSGRLGTGSVLTVRTHADARPEFSILAESVLSAEPTAARQSQLETALGRLTEPLLPDVQKQIGVLPRPLRLLAHPQPIVGTASGRHFPLQVLLSGRPTLLTEFSHPERIQTAWWTDHPCHRDYYQAKTSHGSRLWLFRDLYTNQWFLHGIFD